MTSLQKKWKYFIFILQIKFNGRIISNAGAYNFLSFN